MLITPCRKECNCALLDEESAQTRSDYIHAKVQLEVFNAHWGLLCTETRYYRCIRFGNITVQKKGRRIRLFLYLFLWYCLPHWPSRSLYSFIAAVNLCPLLYLHNVENGLQKSESQTNPGYLWGPFSFLFNGYRRLFFSGGLGAKRLQREVNYSFFAIAEVKNYRSYTFNCPFPS